METLTVGDRQVELDEDGHLADYSQWSPEVAQALADRDGIGELTEEHLAVLRTIRAYYDKFKVPPMAHILTRECGKSFRELHELFRKQPGKRAAKLAGLSKAQGCV